MPILIKKFISIILIIVLFSNVHSTEIQYKVDQNYSSTINNQQAGKVYWYRHSDILKNTIPLISDEQFIFKECQIDQESELIMFISPNFFYNPLMTTLYGELSIKLYSNEKLEFLKNYEDEININLLTNYEYYLSQMYKKIFHQIKLDIPKNIKHKTNSKLCSLL
ncbi:MAG: hypothetical protein VW238_05470 [Nitrosomonadales bacterium]